MVVGHTKADALGVEHCLALLRVRPRARFLRETERKCGNAQMHAFARYKTAPKRLREAIS